MDADLVLARTVFIDTMKVRTTDFDADVDRFRRGGDTGS